MRNRKRGPKMTLDEAIKELEEHTPKAPPYFDPEFVAALKLGTEALNRLRTLRQDPRLSVALPLPSETEYSTGVL